MKLLNPWCKSVVSLSIILATALAGTIYLASCKDDEPTQPPVINSVSPLLGRTGLDIVIVGDFFSITPDQNTVTFGSTPATVISATATTLVVRVPDGATTSKISLSVRGRSITGPEFTVVPFFIKSIAPTTGPSGTRVFIKGSGFGPVAKHNKITFNGEAADVVEGTDSTLTVVVPAGAGSGQLKLEQVDAIDKTLGRLEGPMFDFVWTYRVNAVAGGKRGMADGIRSQASFDSPADLAVDKDGNIYVADLNNFRVRKITPQGKVTTLAGSTYGHAGNADPLKAQFGYVTGITLDTLGNLYVCDSISVYKIAKEKSVVTLLAGGLEKANQYVDGTGEKAGFMGIRALRMSAAQEMYVADAPANALRKITRTGVVTTLAGMPSVGGNPAPAGYADGPANVAQFKAPLSVLPASDSRFYIADVLYNAKIRKMMDNRVSTVTGTSPGWKDGAADQAQFGHLTGAMVMDKFGNIYMADTQHHVIRKIAPDGSVITVAGTPGTTGLKNGAANNALFNSPTSLAVDKYGVIYITDAGNHAIRTLVVN